MSETFFDSVLGPVGRGPGQLQGKSFFDNVLGRSGQPEEFVPPVIEEPALDRNVFGEFFEGISRGLDTELSLIQDFTALGLNAVGAEETALELAAAARENREGAPERTVATIDEALESPGNFLFWAAAALGEQIPILASVIATGGIGALVGKALAKGIITKATAETALTRFAAREGAAQAAGGTIGAIGGATVLETGATSGELLQATGEFQTGTSLVAGMAKGALEAITPLMLAKRLNILDTGIAERLLGRAGQILESRLARAGEAFVRQGLVEGSTEFLQEIVDLAARTTVDEEFDALGPEGAARLLEAAATGALVGAIFGGGAGAFSRPDGGDTKLPEADAPVSPGIPINPAQGAETLLQTSAPTFPGDGSQGQVDSVPLESGQQAFRFGSVDEADRLAGKFGAGNVEGITINKEALKPEQVSAPVDSLPSAEQLSADNPNVTLLDPARTEEAIQLAQAAVNARQVERKDFVERGTTLLENVPGKAASSPGTSTAFYQQALDAGFRFKPKPGGGFFFIGNELPESLITRGAPVPQVGAGRYRQVITNAEQGALARTKDGAFIFETIPTGLVDRTTSRGIGIDLAQMDPKKVSGGRIALNQLVQRAIAESDGSTEGIVEKTIELGNTSDATNFNPARIREVLRDFVTTLSGTEDKAEATGRDLEAAGFRIPVADLTVSPDAGFVNERIKVFVENIEELPLTTASVAQDALTSLPLGLNAEFTEEDSALVRGTIDSRVKSLGAVRADGTVFHDISQLKPGEAAALMDINWQLATQTPGNARGKKARILLKALQQIYTKFMPNARVVFTMDGNLSFDNNDVSGINGYIEGSADLHHINVNKIMRDSAIETLAHEAGHGLVFHELSLTEPHVVAQLFNAYNRDVRAASVQSGTEQAASFLNTPRRADSAGSKTMKSFRKTGGFGEYWANYHEWMAEQFVQYLTVKPVSFVETVLARLGRKVAKLLSSALGIPPGRFNPSVEYRRWADSVKELAKTGKRLPLQLVNDNATNKALRTFADMQDEDPTGENNPPPMAASQPVTKVLDSPLLKQIMSKRERLEMQRGLDKVAWYTKLFTSIQQVSFLNPHIDPLRRYRNHTDQMHIFKTQFAYRADERIREWRAINNTRKKENDFTELLFHMAEGKYMNNEEQKSNLRREPTPEEEAAAFAQFNMTEGQVELYGKVQADFINMIDTMEQIIVEKIERAAKLAEGTQSGELIASKIRQAQAEVAMLKRRPYFPFMRFGDFSLTVRDLNQEGNPVTYFETFPSLKERDKAVEAVEKAFPKANGFSTVQKGKITKPIRSLMGTPGFMLDMIDQQLKLSPEQKQELQKLRVQNLPKQTFRKHFLQRRGVSGWSQDAQRAYGQYFFGASNFLSRLKFQDTLLQDIKDLRRTTLDLEDSTKRSTVIEMVQRHFDDMMNPGEDWAKLRSIAFQWHLGFVPSSAFINLTQIPMVSWPFLGTQFNSNIKAANALRKAATSIHKFYSQPPENVRNKLSAEDRLMFEALDEAMREGVVDESQATELAAIAGHRVFDLTMPGTKAERIFNQSAMWSAYMFQTAEKLNRRITFRAAYDLALQNPEAPYLQELRKQNREQIIELKNTRGWDDRQTLAFMAGRDTVRRTQFEYAQHARPAFLRGKKGAFFMFFMFLQNALWFMRFSPGGTKYLLFVLATSGLMGLPGGEDIDKVIKLISRKLFGKDFNIELMVRDMMKDFTGNYADIILHGTSRAGFGIPYMAEAIGMPMPSFDLSGTLGFGNIIPGLDIITGNDFESSLSRGTADVAGATFGIAFNMAQAMGDTALPWNDWKRWERAMPRAMKNLSSATRLGREGRERTRSGSTLLEFDVYDVHDFGELIGKASGFQPTRLSRRWDAAIAASEIEQYWTGRRSALIREFDFAKNVVGERAAMNAVRVDIKDFNRQVPVNGLRISGKTLAESQRSRRRDRRFRERGLSPQKGARQLSRDTQELFPEVFEEPSPK